MVDGVKPHPQGGGNQGGHVAYGDIAMPKKLRWTAIIKIAGLTFGAAIGAYLATMIFALLLTTAVIFWVMEGQRVVPNEDMQFARVADIIGVVVAAIAGIVGGGIGYRAGNRRWAGAPVRPWWKLWG